MLHVGQKPVFGEVYSAPQGGDDNVGTEQKKAKFNQKYEDGHIHFSIMAKGQEGLEPPPSVTESSQRTENLHEVSMNIIQF